MMTAPTILLLLPLLCLATANAALFDGRRGVRDGEDRSTSTKRGPRGQTQAAARHLQETEALDEENFKGFFGDTELLSGLLRMGMSGGGMGMDGGGMGMESGGMGMGDKDGKNEDGDDDDDGSGNPFDPSPNPALAPFVSTQFPVQSVQPTSLPTPVPVLATLPPAIPPPTPFPTSAPTPAPTIAPTPTPAPTLSTAVQEDACPATPSSGCSVCGEGMCVTVPDAIFSFPGQPSVVCDDLENAGYTKLIPISQCLELPPLIKDTCGCATARPPTTAPPPPPLPTPAASCPEIPTNGCSICGESKCVTNPDAIFKFPDQPDVDCGILEQAGLQGQIPQEDCPFLPNLIGTLCECEGPQQPPPPPTPPPTLPPTLPPTPVAAASCPDVPTTGCSICGESMCVTNSDAIFRFPDQPDVDCGALEQAGLQGQIPLDQCPFLPDLIGTLCECEGLQPRLAERMKAVTLVEHVGSGHHPGE